MEADGFWCAPRSSKPLRGVSSLPGEFDSHMSPPPKRAVDERIASMISRIASYDTIICDNELEAFILEANLIKKYRPRYNILMRDDKEYPYIHVTLQEDFPRVMRAFFDPRCGRRIVTARPRFSRKKRVTNSNSSGKADTRISGGTWDAVR
jgi:hypothetical protein